MLVRKKIFDRFFLSWKNFYIQQFLEKNKIRARDYKKK